MKTPSRQEDVKAKTGEAKTRMPSGRRQKEEPSIPPKKESIYLIHVSLTGSDPLIWRRFLVPGRFTLSRLHQVLQRVMGWEESHLHEFIIAEEHYGRPDWEDDPDFGPKMLDERRFKLISLAPEVGTTFQYMYDFGDGWIHDVKVEAIGPPVPFGYYPACIDGANACPPEDSGGLPGYYEKLRIIKDPDDPEYEEIIEWMSQFSPLTFNLESINRSLRRYFKV